MRNTKHISPDWYRESRERLIAIKENLDKQVPLIKRQQQFWRAWAAEKERLEQKR